MLATAGLFAAALLAMGSVKVFDTLSSGRDPVAPPVVIRFVPPAAPPARATPPTARRPAPTPRATAPAAVPTTIAAPDPAIPVVTPVVPPAPVRDSGAAAAPTIDATARPSIHGLITTRVVPTFPDAAPRRAAAPISRAGVTSPSGTLTVAGRDSIVTDKMKGIVAEALSRPMTKDEKAAVAANSEPGRALPGTRAAGDAPLVNGGSARRVPIASVSVPLPLFTRSPSPIETREQRELRQRLQDRAIFLRDSVRKDSIEKARIRP